jgi:hypothetical protein
MILSVDIGIRNLALCIMDCLDKNDLSTYNLHLWDVFDTLDSEEHLCSSLLKNKKICNKKCAYKYQDTTKSNILKLETKHFTCKTHFPKELLPIQKSNIFKKKMIKDYLLQDIAKIIILKLQLIYNENKILFTKLSSIVLELQPSMNKSMIFVSHLIYAKFIDLQLNNHLNPKCTIKFIRASQKLKAYTGPEVLCKLKGKYAQRKWFSKIYTQWFLENKFNKNQKDKWLPILQSKITQADMSDTFLMAINILHGVPKKQKMNFKKINL